MGLIQSSEGSTLQAITELVNCNPFQRRRIELEKQLLGDDFQEQAPVWSWIGHDQQERPNIQRMADRLEQMVDTLRQRLVEGVRASDREREIYAELVLFCLYHRYRVHFSELIIRIAEKRSGPKRVGFWEDFARDWEHYLCLGGDDGPMQEAPHIFAGFFQLRRAFYYIFRYIVGTSEPTTQLRSAIWESIFTHDFRRYRKSLYRCMADITTLVTGPSGTGKELVARAVGHSRYIPFDPSTGAFVENFAESFHPLNLSAMSPTLIESELFGHKRGAFTGATVDRPGWLETCTPLGTVFLDEIGEIDATIQVKLLRVIQSRSFARLGESAERRFEGKLIAATNRDLGAEMRIGRFREDFYYRLCSDMIRTPSLHEQIADTPQELRRLIEFIVRRVVGEASEALCDETETWITDHLGRDYPWPGNIRELEQCVRNVMIRKQYHPPTHAETSAGSGPRTALGHDVARGALSVDQLLNQYCTLIVAETGSYVEAAKRLGIDRRTVKARVDPKLLERFHAAHGS